MKLTPQALGQIAETVQYISKILLEPEITRKWADTLQSEIKKPDSMPSRYSLTEGAPRRTNGIRRMPVKNFLVYYLVNEEKKTVWVTAVICGRRDQISTLRDMPLTDIE